MKTKKPVGRAKHGPKPEQSTTPNASGSNNSVNDHGASGGFAWNKLLSLKIFLGGLGLTAAGIWAYFTPFIDPMKSAVLHRLYKEKATIILSCAPCTISNGDTARVTVEVTPSPSVDIAEGVLKIRFNDRHLSLSDDTPSSFGTEMIAARRLLDKSFLLYPTTAVSTPIESPVSVVLETKFGSHVSNPVKIFIEPPKTNAEGPYVEPGGRHRVVLTGEWHLELGGSLGGMRIRQTEKNDISGTYWLNEPTGRVEAAIDGYKDGTSFKVFLARPNMQSRWRVDANFFLNAVDKGFIEMKGCAFSVRPDKRIITNTAPSPTGCGTRNYVGWRGDGATTFWASAKLR